MTTTTPARAIPDLRPPRARLIDRFALVEQVTLNGDYDRPLFTRFTRLGKITLTMLFVALVVILALMVWTTGLGKTAAMLLLLAVAGAGPRFGYKGLPISALAGFALWQLML